ncbi:MAG: sulfotransferase domain-containing protein [Thiobacillus sp.]
MQLSKNVFIHIGLPKTGTTYIQHKMHVNSDKLRSNGIYVPKTGLSSLQNNSWDHNLLALALQPERWGQFPSALSKRLPTMWSDLVAEIKSCDCPDVIISAETLSWELDEGEQIRTISQKLHDFDVKIVLCERNPYDLISSMYGQMLRTGRGPYSLESFLLEFAYFWNAGFHQMRWSEHFGEENILSLRYEDLSGDLLFENFLKVIFPGHAVQSERFESGEYLNRNVSLSPRFLRFLEEMSANKASVEPYINLYLESGCITPLESRLITETDIETALASCGMALHYFGEIPKSLPTNIKQQQQFNGIRSFASTSLVHELLETRRLLVERTERLEQASTDLVERTRELVELRKVLAERTAMLEQLIENKRSS